MGRALLPAQVGRHPGPQLRDAEGLGEVVVPAQPQAGEHIGLFGLGGEEENGAVHQPPDAAAEGEPVLPPASSHPAICSPPSGRRIRPPSRPLRRVDTWCPSPLQGGPQQGAEILVIIHHQDMGHHVTSVQQKVQPPGEGVEKVDVGGIEGVEQQLVPAAPPAIIPQHQGRRQDAVDLIVLGEELPPGTKSGAIAEAMAAI